MKYKFWFLLFFSDECYSIALMLAFAVKVKSLMEVNGHRRGRGQHNAGQYNGGVNTMTTVDEFDPWTAWAYKPRTITLLFIGACFLM